MMLFPDSSL